MGNTQVQGHIRHQGHQCAWLTLCMDGLMVGLLAKDLDLRQSRSLVSLRQNNIDILKILLHELLRCQFFGNILDDGHLPGTRNSNRISPGRFVPKGVLTFVIDIKTMDIVFERADAVPPPLQFRDQFFEQRRLAAILFTDNGYDRYGHKWLHFSTSTSS